MLSRKISKTCQFQGKPCIFSNFLCVFCFISSVHFPLTCRKTSSTWFSYSACVFKISGRDKLSATGKKVTQPETSLLRKNKKKRWHRPFEGPHTWFSRPLRLYASQHATRRTPSNLSNCPSRGIASKFFFIFIKCVVQFK